MEAEEVMSYSDTAFKVYANPLTMILSLKYLGRILSASDDYCLSVVANLRKARKSWKTWEHIYWISGKESTDAKTPGKFYNVVVQAVLLFGLETFFVTPRIARIMGGF